MLKLLKSSKITDSIPFKSIISYFLEFANRILPEDSSLVRYVLSSIQIAILKVGFEVLCIQRLAGSTRYEVFSA